MRRTQLYLEEAQYRWLKARAGRRGSIAAVVRALIDAARSGQDDPTRDPLIAHLLGDAPRKRRKRSTVQTLDEEVYGA